MTEIKSPLIYPGSKSSVVDQLVPLIPEFKEYREPFIGSASIFLAVKQKYPDKEYWINDLSYELYNFFKMCQEDIDSVIEQIIKWRNEYKDKYNGGKELFYNLKRNIKIYNEIELASAYYIINKTAFSGASLVAGFSQDHYNAFCEEDINDLSKLKEIFKNVKITNLDYQKVIELPSKFNHEDVFLMCCLPKTKIRMKDERLLSIENVKIGDKTFLGGDVIKSINRNYHGNIYEFEIMGIYDNLCVTEEHPLAVIGQRDVYQKFERYSDGSIHISKFKHQDILDKINIRFLRSRDIDIGDFLLIPCYSENIISVKNVIIGDNNIPCNYDFGWVCGFWLAEANINRYYGKDITVNPKRIKDIEDGKQSTLGFFDDYFEISADNITTEMENIEQVRTKSRYDSCNSVSYSCGENDRLYGFIDKLEKWYNRYFGIKGHVYYYENTHSYRIDYCHRDISKFMYSKFGEYAENKYIDNDFLNYPLEFQQGLLQGWLDGDGGNYVDRRDRTKITGTTISKKLALNMYSISLRLGLKPMIKYRGNRIWDVYFSSDDAIILSSNLSNKYTSPNKEYGHKSKRRIIKKGDLKFIISPITDINISVYNGPVYNLTTKNHVYIANYVLNHNCDPPYAAATESGLYGKGGGKWSNLHKIFDHYRFAEIINSTNYRYLITYDDSPFVNRLFPNSQKKSWTFTHKMRDDRIGKELLISNFEINMLTTTQQDIVDSWLN